MKITRKQLRQLINEALKPFFMGVPPTSIISQLLDDPRVDAAAKELLRHPDPEIQRTGITLIQDPDVLASYPELDDVDIAAPEFMPDLIDRSQPAYAQAYDDAQLRMSDIALRSSMGFDSNATPDQKIELIDKVAKDTYPSVVTKKFEDNPHGTKGIIIYADPPGGINVLDPDDTKRFLKRMDNLALDHNIYLQQRHMIMFLFDLVAINRGDNPSYKR